MNKRYVFFYHYYKQYNAMSVHFKGSCHRVQHVDCRVPCKTIWRDTQPKLIMKGLASDVVFENNTAIIQ